MSDAAARRILELEAKLQEARNVARTFFSEAQLYGTIDPGTLTEFGAAYDWLEPLVSHITRIRL